jgi:hypothetical protein
MNYNVHYTHNTHINKILIKQINKSKIKNSKKMKWGVVITQVIVSGQVIGL